MSTFWRWLTGSDPEAPRRARRPREGLRPELTSLEGRQLMAVLLSKGTTLAAKTVVTSDIILPSATTLKKGTTLTDNIILPNGITLETGTTPSNDVILPSGTILTKGELTLTVTLPPVQVSPKFLFPSDGRYVPVSISGGLNNVYVMNFVGKYAVFPKPASTANILSQLPLAGPTEKTPLTTPGQTQTYTAFVPGSKAPLTVSYTLDSYLPGVAVYTLKLPDYQYPMTIAVVWQGPTQKNAKGTYDGSYDISFRTLPISDFESSVITTRFDHRKGPADAVLNVTDQYRQDEPRADTPLTLLAAPITSFLGSTIFVKSTFPEKITIPTGETIVRQYSYSFSTHLQALKHPGTGGRQYIINVSAEDADDGDSVNTAVIVPNDAPTIRR